MWVWWSVLADPGQPPKKLMLETRHIQGLVRLARCPPFIGGPFPRLEIPSGVRVQKSVLALRAAFKPSRRWYRPSWHLEIRAALGRPLWCRERADARFRHSFLPPAE